LGGDVEYRAGDIFRLEDTLAMFFRYRRRMEFEDRRIHLAGINVGYANAAVFFLRAQADAEGRHAEFRSGVGEASQRRRPFAGDAVDVDNQAVLASEHPRKDSVDAIEGAVEIGAEQSLPHFRRQFAKAALFDV